MAFIDIVCTSSRGGYLVSSGIGINTFAGSAPVQGRTIANLSESRQFFGFNTSGVVPVNSSIFQVEFLYSLDLNLNSPGSPDLWASDFYFGNFLDGGLHSSDWSLGTFVWTEDWASGQPEEAYLLLPPAAIPYINPTGWTDVKIADNSAWSSPTGSWSSRVANGRCALRVYYTDTGNAVYGKGKVTWTP